MHHVKLCKLTKTWTCKASMQAWLGSIWQEKFPETGCLNDNILITAHLIMNHDHCSTEVHSFLFHPTHIKFSMSSYNWSAALIQRKLGLKQSVERFSGNVQCSVLKQHWLITSDWIPNRAEFVRDGVNPAWLLINFLDLFCWLHHQY